MDFKTKNIKKYHLKVLLLTQLDKDITLYYSVKTYGLVSSLPLFTLLLTGKSFQGKVLKWMTICEKKVLTRALMSYILG